MSSAKTFFGYNGTAVIDPPGWDQNNGTGQTVGIIAFDTFQMSDVSDYLELIGQPATRITDVSEVKVNGGATPGANQDEVLLDTAIVLDLARGAKVVAFDAPFTGAGTSFQALFNAAINGGSTIISNSWAYCEDQTTLADVQSIDSIFQAAAAAGITVLNASGDSGSTCLDGSANTVAVPADSPNATAVGGSSFTLGNGYTYGSEKWWDGTLESPPTGQGGFGVSRFFNRPAYQTGFTASPMRSVPDVVVNADPAKGAFICQAAKGGCPTGLLYGGTSAAAPQLAAHVAILNQALGSNIGSLNQAIYPFANTTAFHNAASLGSSDFAHVGLGSPNVNLLFLQLSGQTLGAPNASISEVFSYLEGPFPSSVAPYADGQTQVFVNVRLLDDNGNPVNGKTIALAANAGSQAVISPPSAVTTVNNGIAIFKVTNLIPEQVTFTATDVSDGIVLQQTSGVAFVTPPAASATTITLTLQDALSRPTPGKLITLAQNGHSVISGTTPQITDSNGQIQFTAVDQFPETVTYTATDVTDGNLAFPSTGTVTFSGGIANGCGNGNPTPGPGFLVTSYVTGFVAQNFSYGNVNFGGCPGATGMAFDGSGNLYVADAPTGNIYRFPPGGGVANGSTLLTSAPLGPSLSGLAFDKNGNLFASRFATTGNFTTGAILQINPTTGAVIRTVASNLTCPGTISIDPLSGDLFTDDSCGGGGSENPSLWRIANPGGPSPTTSVYATLPGPTNATVAFAPSGTLYVWSFTGSNTQVLKVSGTNGPSTPTISVLPGLSVSFLGLLAEGTQANGDADFLVLNFPAQGNTPGGIGITDLTSNPSSLSTTLITNNGGAQHLIKGPGGCIYAAQGNAVFKITDTSGACNYLSTPPAPTITLSPTVISPNPVQGNPDTFTAALHFVPAPVGTPVFFTVTGANPQIKLVRADANGKATFTYTAVFAGNDTISASTTVNTATVTSNPVPVTWAAGEHVTFLSLNPSPAGGTLNKQLIVTASLTDVSATPAAPVANQVVNFTLDGGTCTATTDVKGIASCSLTPFILGGGTLTASFAGTNQLIPATASIGFNTMAVAIEPLPTVTISVNPATVATGVNAALTWSSTNATACTASGAWSGSQSISGNQNVSQAQPGTYTYTLACNGPGGSASKSASLMVKQFNAVCDVNQDGFVSKSDISIISKNLRKTVPVGTSGDINRDGLITTQDTRGCTLQCSLPKCAEPAR